MALDDIKGFSTFGIKNAGSGLSGRDLVKRDLLNHFMTRVGERIGRPLFGCRIWDWLYEPMTRGLEIRCGEEVTRIAKSDGRVGVGSVSVFTFEHGIVAEVSLIYKNEVTVESFRISFDQRQEI
jgi:phage baseplate assembly protein W